MASKKVINDFKKLKSVQGLEGLYRGKYDPNTYRTLPALYNRVDKPEKFKSNEDLIIRYQYNVTIDIPDSVIEFLNPKHIIILMPAGSTVLSITPISRKIEIILYRAGEYTAIAIYADGMDHNKVAFILPEHRRMPVLQGRFITKPYGKFYLVA